MEHGRMRQSLTVSAPSRSELLPPLQPAYTLLRQAFWGAATRTLKLASAGDVAA